MKEIFKKSEHEEIMDELREIKKSLPTIPYIPYVPPYDPCRHCHPGWGCGNCPYRYDPDWNRFHPPWYCDQYIYPYSNTVTVGTAVEVPTCI